MNPKSSEKNIDRSYAQTGSISQAIQNSEDFFLGKTQPTPDGFPCPTTVMFITAKNDGGTIPKHILEINQILKKIGARVLVAGPVTPPFGIEFKKQADKFIQISDNGFSLATLWKLRKKIRKHRVNIVHSHGHLAGIYSRILGLISKASVVHSPHVTSKSGSLLDKILDRILSITKFDAVFSSAGEQTRALKQGIILKNRESQIIESAVDLSKFAVRKSSVVALKKVDPDKTETFSQIRIGAFLRPESPRGHNAFLKLAKEAATHGQFTCAGISPQQLMKYGAIPQGLEVVGPIADHSHWLYSLDVFVSTSSADGQVNGASEAIAAGAVCLLSKIPPHEPFHGQHAALLFDAKSTLSFVEALTSVKKDRALRDMLLGNSRYMLERFNDADSFKNKFIDVYRTCVKRAAGLVL